MWVEALQNVAYEIKNGLHDDLNAPGFSESLAEINKSGAVAAAQIAKAFLNPTNRATGGFA